MNPISTILSVYTTHILPVLNWASFLPVLGLRLWIADIFFTSGQTKLLDWQGTIALFADEYKVPVLPPEIAATLGTGTELIAPILLVLGLGGRFAAGAMLGMTAIIEFTYMHFDVHVIWALVLALIIFQGSGKASLDYLISKKYTASHMAA
jgi:putative oxidoreductase